MDNTKRKEELQYVQSMLRELQGITVREEFLSYLIEMAYLEASDIIRAVHAEAGADASLRNAA